MAVTKTLCAPATIKTLQSSTAAQLAASGSLLESLRLTHWGAGFSDISVVIEENVVYLRGSVPSYHLKQMAQTLAARLSDGLPVVNWLVVRSADWPSFEQPHRPR
ncbi:BON domain-containing protein [Botrimarina mediterranea]|uniref:BON domain protein n=1 Tax=Botrimarina mediterranea TaxID=2528022 RepID=A0A518K9J9_9BACT|nr:BON domain-containing protein [Botrimarina mediterranea]QDV74467.1 BON domain protein [Botrimarina mediterranea]QDV79063.1 BON domain protein [Planctomycetes bacterium K2D]